MTNPEDILNDFAHEGIVKFRSVNVAQTDPKEIVGFDLFGPIDKRVLRELVNHPGFVGMETVRQGQIDVRFRR